MSVPVVSISPNAWGRKRSDPIDVVNYDRTMVQTFAASLSAMSKAKIDVVVKRGAYACAAKISNNPVAYRIWVPDTAKYQGAVEPALGVTIHELAHCIFETPERLDPWIDSFPTDAEKNIALCAANALSDPLDEATMIEHMAGTAVPLGYCYWVTLLQQFTADPLKMDNLAKLIESGKATVNDLTYWFAVMGSGVINHGSVLSTNGIDDAVMRCASKCREVWWLSYGYPRTKCMTDEYLRILKDALPYAKAGYIRMGKLHRNATAWTEITKACIAVKKLIQDYVGLPQSGSTGGHNGPEGQPGPAGQPNDSQTTGNGRGKSAPSGTPQPKEAGGSTGDGETEAQQNPGKSGTGKGSSPSDKGDAPPSSPDGGDDCGASNTTDTDNADPSDNMGQGGGSSNKGSDGKGSDGRGEQGDEPGGDTGSGDSDSDDGADSAGSGTRTDKAGQLSDGSERGKGSLSAGDGGKGTGSDGSRTDRGSDGAGGKGAGGGDKGLHGKLSILDSSELSQARADMLKQQAGTDTGSGGSVGGSGPIQSAASNSHVLRRALTRFVAPILNTPDYRCQTPATEGRRTGDLVRYATDGQCLLKTGRYESDRTAMAILLDTSGSMEKLVGIAASAAAGMAMAMQRCGASMRCFTFNSDVCDCATGRPGASKSMINNLANSEATGGTNTQLGIVAAAKWLKDQTEPNKMLVIFTDGEPNDDEATREACLSLKRYGIKLIAATMAGCKVEKLTASMPNAILFDATRDLSAGFAKACRLTMQMRSHR